MDLENQVTNFREEIGSLVIIHRIQNGHEIRKVTYIENEKRDRKVLDRIS